MYMLMCCEYVYRSILSCQSDCFCNVQDFKNYTDYSVGLRMHVFLLFFCRYNIHVVLYTVANTCCLPYIVTHSLVNACTCTCTIFASFWVFKTIIEV